MKLKDILSWALQNLKRRKSRTLLTMLGVMIGCCSILVMVSIGIGLSEYSLKSIAQMGDLTTIEVYSGYDSTENALNDEAIASFSALENVTGVTPKYEYNNNNRITVGNSERFYADYMTLVGIDFDNLSAMDYTLLEGSIPTSENTQVLAGQFFAYYFNDSARPEGSNSIDYWDYYETGEMPEAYFDPLSETFTLELYADNEEQTPVRTTLKVSGIVEENYAKGYETSQGIIMDLDLMKSLIKKVNQASNSATKAITYTQALVKVDDIDHVADVEDQITQMGFSTYSTESMRQSMQEQMRQIQMVLGGIGAVSLLVAAIGIANTMIMSISERTKEIGIMKVLGCRVRDIRTMFLCEAGLIGLLGGIAGVLLSYIISFVINMTADGSFDLSPAGIWTLLFSEDVSRISVIPLWLLLFSLLFSILIGVASGLYPAIKATKIEALQAIHHE
jgi:ABC-type antimicrobial peptide transport system permease subunit